MKRNSEFTRPSRADRVAEFIEIPAGSADGMIFGSVLRTPRTILFATPFEAGVHARRAFPRLLGTITFQGSAFEVGVRASCRAAEAKELHHAARFLLADLDRTGGDNQ